jgi:hypothetical protein
MTFEEIEKYVSDHIDLIKINATALAQGKERAAKFLVIQAILSNHLKCLEEGKALVTTSVEATYAQVILGANGKNVTENKITAAADPRYTSQREAAENLDAEINWVKTHMKIFDNAHIMFRQYTKE